ncbi:MAG: sulfotransferase, partial [Planctomycetia bacterium]|nr:sulfotransferase [Planctomycetia bacterium]
MLEPWLETRAASGRPVGGAAPVSTSVPMCVHLGMTKTGTKTLQCHLFPCHSQIEYLGKFIPGSVNYPGRRHRDSAVKRIITNLLDGGVFQPDFDLCRRLARESLAVASPGRRVMIWSAEELCKGPSALHRARAANLRAVFGGCRIMITLRHPVKHVESEYLQSVKIAHVGRNWEKYRAIGLFDVETRLEELWSQGEENDLSKLLYAKTIAAYREVFGHEAIGVFLFEELLHDPRRYVCRLCEFLGIDPHEGWAL